MQGQKESHNNFKRICTMYTMFYDCLNYFAVKKIIKGLPLKSKKKKERERIET